jgi:GNAT superfamily N-acetyltransferase
MTDVEVHPLDSGRMSDLGQVFGTRGDPSWCWCASFRLPASEFGRNPAYNRSVLEGAIDTTGADGRAPGLVAYRRGVPVGWVSLGPRQDYVRLAQSRLLAPIDDTEVWSIVCFVVARAARGQGIADGLLGAAVAYAREHGAAQIEAYPVETEGGRIPSANAYVGTTAMFLRAGFEVVARRRATATSVVRPIVRKAL